MEYLKNILLRHINTNDSFRSVCAGIEADKELPETLRIIAAVARESVKAMQPVGFVDPSYFTPIRGRLVGTNISPTKSEPESPYSYTEPLYSRPSVNLAGFVSDDDIREIIRIWNRSENPKDAYEPIRQYLRGE